MASQFSLIHEVVAGRVDWTLRVRLTNLWCLSSKNNPGETMQIEMLLIDEKRGKILAVVPKSWVSKYVDMLGEGCAYLLEGVTVHQNDVKFPRTSHKFKLMFMGTTKISPIDAPEIPLNSFDFWGFDSILKEKRTDLFIDVIGHVVQKDNLIEKDFSGKTSKLLDIVLEDKDHQMVRCTLWEGFAERMQAYLVEHATTVPVVVLIHQARLTNFKGAMGVSTGFHGTKLYINQALPEIIEYRLSMPEADAALSQPVTQIAGSISLSLADDLLQSRHMTIADLLAATEECFGSVLVTVVELNMDQGWSYTSCNTCMKFVKLLDNKFTCGKCKVPVTASPRYKLNLQVIDETGSTTFTLFNTLVSSYVGRSAEDLIRANENRPAAGDTPVEFLSLIGKQFLFKVAVTELNIKQGWQTYTVKKFTSEVSIIEKFLSHHKLLGSIPEEEDEDMYHDADCQLDDIPPVLALTSGDVKGKAILLVEEFDQTLSNKNLTQTPVSIMPIKANNLGNPAFLSDAEVGESLNSFFQDLQETPPNKTPGKRAVAELDGIDFTSLDFSPESAAKLPKNNPDDCSQK